MPASASGELRVRSAWVSALAAFGLVVLLAGAIFIFRERLNLWRNEWYPFGAGDMTRWPTSALLIAHGLLFGLTALATAWLGGGGRWRWAAGAAGAAVGIAWGLTVMGLVRGWIEWRLHEPLFGVARTSPPDTDRWVGEAFGLLSMTAAACLFAVTRSWWVLLAGAAVSLAAGLSVGLDLRWLEWRSAPELVMSLWQLAMAAPALTWAWRRRLHLARARGGAACAQCGYSLAGLKGAVCPECGAALTEVAR